MTRFALLLCLILAMSYNTLSAEIKPISMYCSYSENNRASTRYRLNINRLLNQKLYMESHKSRFFNATDGKYPNEVYGHYLCIAPQTCQSCIYVATDTITERCDGTKEAIIFYEDCFLSYSNRPFPSNPEAMNIAVRHNTTHNVSHPDRFYHVLNASLTEVIEMATASSTNYATHKARISSNNSETVFSMAQCIPNLSEADCRHCLSYAFYTLEDYMIEGRSGATFFCPICSTRYELYQFVTNTTTSAANIRGYGRKATWIITGTTISALLLVALLGSYLWRSKRWRHKAENDGRDSSQEVHILGLEGERFGNEYAREFQGENQANSKDYPQIRLGLILTATRNFSEENKLGQCGFGPVYNGTLADGKEVAVKRLSRTSGQGLQEFKNEVTLIAKLQHKNLVRLLGCCLEGNELLLIYEYMPNKSLDVFLFDSTRGAQLDWNRRISIINGIARGLLYLHEDSRLRIIHRDLKASNILLDNEMNPKISDFGMARIFGASQSRANTNRVVGTYGYMAPEYAMQGLFSVKSDVFSFGVLLLEIISGKKNNGFYLSEPGQGLLSFTWKLWCEGKGLEQMDPLVEQTCVAAELLKCIHIGLFCVQEDPADRPTMSSVVIMLGSSTVTLPQPTQPAFYLGPRAVTKSAKSFSGNEICSVNEVTLSNVSPR